MTVSGHSFTGVSERLCGETDVVMTHCVQHVPQHATALPDSYHIPVRDAITLPHSDITEIASLSNPYTLKTDEGSISTFTQYVRGGGSGTQAKVYLGVLSERDREDDATTPVAVKVSGCSATSVAAIEHEVAMLKKAMLAGPATHAHIVTLKGYGRCGVRAFVAMELYDVALSTLLEEGFVFAPKLAEFAAALLRALVHLHSVGIVHRDVKPANLLLCGCTNMLKLADFATAERVGHVCTERQPFTPGFAAPEVLGDATVRTASDIWAFAVTLVALACGKAEEKIGPCDDKFFTEHASQEKLDADPRLHSIPPPLQSVVKKALRLDHTERLSAGKLRRMLE